LGSFAGLIDAADTLEGRSKDAVKIGVPVADPLLFKRRKQVFLQASRMGISELVEIYLECG
jgi:hypothetical protein